MENLQKSSSVSVSSSVAFMQHVYIWMFAGLLLTAGVSYLFASVPALMQIVLNPMALIVMVIANLGLVMYINLRIDKMSPTQASGYFLLYAALLGAWLSPLLLMYTASSIATSFLIASSMFGAMAVYGWVTKRNLSAWGSFLMMGLIGLLVTMLISLIWPSPAMQFVINIAGVIIFAGFTAYDHQRIKAMGDNAPWGDDVAIRRGAILGALSLYLDFINLFLFILRIFGNRE